MVWRKCIIFLSEHVFFYEVSAYKQSFAPHNELLIMNVLRHLHGNSCKTRSDLYYVHLAALLIFHPWNKISAPFKHYMHVFQGDIKSKPSSTFHFFIHIHAYFDIVLMAHYHFLSLYLKVKWCLVRLPKQLAKRHFLCFALTPLVPIMINSHIKMV